MTAACLRHDVCAVVPANASVSDKSDTSPPQTGGPGPTLRNASSPAPQPTTPPHVGRAQARLTGYQTLANMVEVLGLPTACFYAEDDRLARLIAES